MYHGDHRKQRAKNIPYKDLPEEKNEELRRKQRERYTKKKASSSNSLQLKDSTSFDGDQLTTSIDERSNDDVQHINIIQDFTVLQKVSKRQRIFHADVDIGELISSHEATSSLNDVTDRSNCSSDSMDFLTRKSGNTYIDETTVSNKLHMLFGNSQVLKQVYRHLVGVRNQQLLQIVPSEAYSLPYVPYCRHCKAKRFYHETNGFCCADGTISLATNAVPNQLYDLFTSNTDESVHFKTYVRTYNNKFAFTSFGVKFNKDLCRWNRGVYTFRTQGQIYHYIDDLIPLNGRPSYLQLYFYDTEHELENRISDSDRMNPSIIAELIDILRINPYSVFFRSLDDLSNLKNQVIHIRSDVGLDQRVFNTSTSSQVAAIWVENEDADQLRGRDICVFSHSGGSHIVQYYFGCYDPL
ncbi:hypothetical protein I3843_03G089800 [Carya illinoinensis]|nr:hypothetical protein I3843_03G089800 [Carya illinoinensis]